MTGLSRFRTPQFQAEIVKNQQKLLGILNSH